MWDTSSFTVKTMFEQFLWYHLLLYANTWLCIFVYVCVAFVRKVGVTHYNTASSFFFFLLSRAYNNAYDCLYTYIMFYRKDLCIPNSREYKLYHLTQKNCCLKVCMLHVYVFIMFMYLYIKRTKKYHQHKKRKDNYNSGHGAQR